jgi:hypothetical protein
MVPFRIRKRRQTNFCVPLARKRGRDRILVVGIMKQAAAAASALAMVLWYHTRLISERGQKVIPRPSADYFVVGRRQKTSILVSCLPVTTTVKKLADYKDGELFLKKKQQRQPFATAAADLTYFYCDQTRQRTKIEAQGRQTKG